MSNYDDSDDDDFDYEDDPTINDVMEQINVIKDLQYEILDRLPVKKKKGGTGENGTI
jgi:hypothetical protein